jgi:molybdopterin converting factor small subunit
LKVKVRYLGYISSLLRKRDDEFEFNEGASLSELLNKLAGIHGEAFRREVFEPGLTDVKTGFVVTVNGVLMGQLHGINTKLSEGDNVILMTLVSGG